MEDHSVGLPPIELTIRSSSGAIVLGVRGEIDAATVESLKFALAVVEDAAQLVVDLSATTFVDIAGVRALAACAMRRGAFGCDTALRAPPPATERILRMAPFCRDLLWEPREDSSSAASGA